MRSPILLLTFMALLATSLPQAFGHGEDKPGPHGGYIRMPGAFHTEVVPSGDQIKIFLLDINWKNPTVKDSQVEAALSSAARRLPLTCSAQKDHFLCPLPKGETLASGTLELRTRREGQTGNTAQYDLPLSFKTKKTDHSGHH